MAACGTLARMNADELRAAQAPLKARYKTDHAAAMVTLKAEGVPDVPTQVCRVETHLGVVDAGLHPATAGDGTKACSGDVISERSPRSLPTSPGHRRAWDQSRA